MNRTGIVLYKAITITLLQTCIVTTSSAGTVTYSVVSGNKPDSPVFYKYRHIKQHDKVLPRSHKNQILNNRDFKKRLVQSKSPVISITERIPGQKPHGKIVHKPGNNARNDKWIFRFREMNKDTGSGKRQRRF